MSILVTTEGIVLHSIPFSESSIIVHIFTRTMGVRSYIVKGVHSRNGKIRRNQLEPFNHIELTAYHSSKSDLLHVKEISLLSIGEEHSMIDDALRFFKTELLYKTLRNEDPQPELFDHLISQSPYPITHQPILFMLTLSHYLGIEPMDNYSHHNIYFNPIEGRFVSTINATKNSLPEEIFDVECSTLLHNYLQTIHHAAPLPVATQSKRNQLLDLLLKYYSLHLNELHHITSHQILHTVLS